MFRIFYPITHMLYLHLQLLHLLSNLYFFEHIPIPDIVCLELPYTLPSSSHTSSPLPSKLNVSNDVFESSPSSTYGDTLSPLTSVHIAPLLPNHLNVYISLSLNSISLIKC